VENRFEALLSIIGVRTGAAGFLMALGPRFFRHVVQGFLKLSDNELRIIGYVLLGTSASIFAQRVFTRGLKAKLEAKLEALGTKQPTLSPAA
jgi:uncharacterized protein YjeT (DUF2065 family)